MAHKRLIQHAVVSFYNHASCRPVSEAARPVTQQNASKWLHGWFLCLQGLEIEGDCVLSLNLKGLALHNSGRIEDAYDVYRLAHQVDPGRATHVMKSRDLHSSSRQCGVAEDLAS